jgi:hypothetical protein
MYVTMQDIMESQVLSLLYDWFGTGIGVVGILVEPRTLGVGTNTLDAPRDETKAFLASVDTFFFFGSIFIAAKAPHFYTAAATHFLPVPTTVVVVCPPTYTRAPVQTEARPARRPPPILHHQHRIPIMGSDD